MADIPPGIPSSPPALEIKHFKRFPTGGTQFMRDPRAFARDRVYTIDDIYPAKPLRKATTCSSDSSV